jgi:hypothetical protein
MGPSKERGHLFRPGIALSEGQTVVSVFMGGCITQSSTGVGDKECGASMASSNEHWGKRKQEAAEWQSLKGRVH